jgi:hypothetical protein
MTDDPLRYDLWIEDAFRSVVRRALNHTATHGLPGDHHFYITFRTQAPGVRVPSYLKAQHPLEMTIVLQHKFDDLAITDDGFSVTLSFKNKRENLYIPFAAVASFSDPSVSFGLQFKVTADGQVHAQRRRRKSGARLRAGWRFGGQARRSFGEGGRTGGHPRFLPQEVETSPPRPVLLQERSCPPSNTMPCLGSAPTRRRIAA